MRVYGLLDCLQSSMLWLGSCEMFYIHELGNKPALHSGAGALEPRHGRAGELGEGKLCQRQERVAGEDE